MKKLALTFAVILLCGTINAQSDTTVAKRKKVAVVLSGGGAKGMSHVGVLKVLEKAGIPIDIVTGTSIGSIVGGLYSIGYNANAIDSLVRTLDWTYVISDKEDMSNQSLSDRRKQNTYQFTTGLTFGKRDPNAGGLIKGTNLANLFQRLCVGYTDSLDFNRDLRIPFACVATNIMDNSEVVFHSGRLPQAMRASMAIPAAFSPVRIGDMVLVDGGLKNNFPVDVAREMGADIVIGITLSGKPKKAEDITGTMKIVGQIIDVNCVNKYDENKAITDLYMNVDPHNYSTASFTKEAIDSLIRYGEEEAMAHWDEIIALKKRIGIDDSFRPTIYQPLRPNVLTERRKVVDFSFENMTPQAESYLRQKFHLNKVDSIDAKLGDQLTTTMRMDLFYHTAECRLEPDGDGVRVVLTAGERKSMQLHAGVRFDNEEYAAILLGLDIPFKTAIPVETDITLRLNKRFMARAEITAHPRSFTRPTLSCTYYKNVLDVYRDGSLDYDLRFDQIQTELLPFNFDLRHFNFKLGIRWDYIHFRDVLGKDMTRRRGVKNENIISYRARVTYNNEDSWYFPTRGTRFNAEYAYVTNNFVKVNEYTLDGKKLGKVTGMSDVSANWRMSFSFNSRFTLQPMLYGRMLFGPYVPPVFSNTLGGEWNAHYLEQQMPFAGIGHMEYIDRHFVALQLQAQQRIGTNNYVLLRFASGQQADKAKNLLDRRPLLGGQIAYYYNSFVGPLGASLGYSNHTKKMYLFMNLGFVF